MSRLSSRKSVRARLDVEPLEARETPAALIGLNYEPGRVIVAFADPGTETAAAANLAESPLVSGVERLGMGAYQAQLAQGVTVSAAVTVFSTLPGVAAVQPDYPILAAALPNDTRIGEQWHFRNPSSGVGGISAGSGWDAARGTGQTIVAVIDSGIDYNHPDLAGNLWRNPREIAGNGRDDDGNGFIDDIHGADFVANTGNPADQFGHGTHVAGVIGAVGNNGLGVSGVAWNTRIMALKFMDSNGYGFTSNAIRAVDYAVANGAKIINASWGGAPYDAALNAALQRAQQAGVIFVASAGNSAANTDVTRFYPAGYITGLSNVVSVAATDMQDNLASFSNFGGTTVTLAAPGVNILSTTVGGGYGLKSGTSMAAPIVAGALAALWDKNPTWSYQQVIAKLRASVDPLPALAGRTQTGGRLNLAKLLDAPASPPPPVSPPPVTAPPPVSPPVSPPPVTTGAGPRVTQAAFTGSRAGIFDRLTVTFDRAINPSTLNTNSVTLSGPQGAFRVSAVLAAANSGNRTFTLMFNQAQTSAGTYTAAIGPDVRDAAGNRMDQNGNGVGGEVGDRFTLTGNLGGTSAPPASPPVSPPPVSPPPPPVSPPPVTGNRTEFTRSNIGAPVNDLRTTRIDFFVPNSFTVSDLRVTLTVAHGRTSDLFVRIVAPNGQVVNLFNRRAGTGLSGTTFADGGALLANGSGTFAGTFRPEQLLSTLNGINARGEWSVQVIDLAAGITGSVTGVKLSFAAPGSAANAMSLDGAGVSPVPTPRYEVAHPANTFQPLTKKDLRAASPDTQAAVLEGKPDTIIVPTPPRPADFTAWKVWLDGRD